MIVRDGLVNLYRRASGSVWHAMSSDTETACLGEIPFLEDDIIEKGVDSRVVSFQGRAMCGSCLAKIASEPRSDD